MNIIKLINDTESEREFIRLGASELARDMMTSKFMKDIFLKFAEDIDYMGYEEPKGLLLLRQEIVNTDDIIQSISLGEAESSVKNGIISKDDIISEIGAVIN